MYNKIIPLPDSDNPRVPRIEAPYRHGLPLQLRFNDIDVVGHVNNAVCLQFFDLGKTRYLAHVMGTGFDMSEVRAVIVNVECNFYEPIFMDDNVSVYTRTAHIGNRSITMDQRIADPATGRVKCTCRTILAGFDPHTQSSAPLPAEYVAALRSFEENPDL